MKTNTLFQVRFKPSVKPPRGFTKSAHYNVLSYDWHNHKYLIGNTWLHASNFIKIKVEDAPVFQKPPLRKIASLKPDEVIELGEHADLVLKQAYKEGHIWPYGTNHSGDTLPKDACLRVFEPGKIMWDHKLNYQSYNLTILPASKFVEVRTEAKGVIEDLPTGKQLIQSHIDAQFEKPAPAPELKPFPDGYEIPEGTRVVVIESHRYGGENSTYIKAGETGTTIDKSTCPDVKFDSGILHYNGESYLDVYNHNLAPLDPRDHPEHPEFGKNKQEEPIKSNIEQIKSGELAIENDYTEALIKLVSRIFPLKRTPAFGCWKFYFAKKSNSFHWDCADETTLPTIKASDLIKEIETQEPITQAQKDECLKLQERIKELEALCELRLKDQEGLADEAENYREANSICINRINRIESFAKAAIESNNDTLHKVALRAIANGEI